MKNKTFLLFISPWIVGFVLLTLGPMLLSLFMSFTKWDMITQIEFVGLRNYEDLLFHTPDFWQSLKVTFLWILFLPVGLILSLFYATLLNRKIKGQVIFRTIIYIPVIVPAVVNCLLWLWLFNPNYGLINMILGLFNINKVDWLLSSRTALISLIIMSLWQLGSNVVIFLAALQGVSQETLEAAEIDGANKVKRYFAITIPAISPTILFQLIMGIIGGLQVFTPAALMTSGGPLKAIYFYVYYIYVKVFEEYQMGFAAALSWILFLIIFVLVLIVFKITYKKVYYEN